MQGDIDGTKETEVIQTQYGRDDRMELKASLLLYFSDSLPYSD